MADNSRTQFFDADRARQFEVGEILEQVYKALQQKGYNPVNQIVGYVMSGDPTYITSFGNARSLIMKFERDEILEELVKFHVENTLGKTE